VNFSEAPLSFDCHGAQLLGILAKPVDTRPLGVVIVVGGPQYRVGSHRQFVRLARRLAADGYPVLRFDCRGMGDSGGAPRPFDDIDDDIEAAIGTLCASVASVRGVALWGLCDAASAAAMYVACRDPRVQGVALLNPWVRSEEGQAKAQLKHYYRARLTSTAFWSNLLSGRIAVKRATSELAGSLWRMVRARRFPVTAAGDGNAPRFQARMANGLEGFDLPTLVLLSGRDLTAREFADLAGADRTWRRLMQRPNVRCEELLTADHTFSNGDSRTQVERVTLEWLASCYISCRRDDSEARSI
jgi:uncharacterized protein